MSAMAPWRRRCMIKLYPHQQKELDETEGMTHVAYYHDMGLGKTFTGAEKMMRLGAQINLVICQKSKVNDWAHHFEEYYSDECVVYDLTKAIDYTAFFQYIDNVVCVKYVVGIINYELAFRRPQLKQLKDFTLMLDESSMIQNETAKRSKFILGLQPRNVILLSGTPTGGKYEKLWSQLHLLGWNISKDLYWRQYVDVEIKDNEGFPIKIVKGYKNVDRLKRKLRQCGCRFLKTDEVFDLPQQNFTSISISTTAEYRKFKKSSIVTVEQKPYALGDDFEVESPVELVGDTTLKKMLYERQLCGALNDDKVSAFRDLLESTEDRLIVFYNFTYEAHAIAQMCEDAGRKYSRVNGVAKDLRAYEEVDGSVTIIQYQAGAMGLNLQKANKIVYFTPPLSSEFFEQSKKRIHRIGQKRPCFYYMLVCKNSVEEKIYAALEKRKDYTEALFEKDEK